MKNETGIFGVCILLSAMAFADTSIMNGVEYQMNGGHLEMFNGQVYEDFGGVMRFATPVGTAQTSNIWTCEGNGGSWRYHGGASAGYSISGSVTAYDAIPPAICPTAVKGSV
jgi:hypothetical protein